jgi:hypothetical protein
MEVGQGPNEGCSAKEKNGYESMQLLPYFRGAGYVDITTIPLLRQHLPASLPPLSHIKPEKGSSAFLRNVDNRLQKCTLSPPSLNNYSCKNFWSNMISDETTDFVWLFSVLLCFVEVKATSRRMNIFPFV